MNKLIEKLTLAAAAASLVVLSACTGNAICTKQAECLSDPPGADFIAVCETRYSGGLRALRANKEDECHELAATQEAFDACRSQLDCNDFNEGDNNGECDDERDDFFDALRDAQSECGTLD